jgi:hypothetical protein
VGAAGPDKLQPELWLNPYSSFYYTYQQAPSSYSAYNPVVFDSFGVTISGDSAAYSYIGARYYQQIFAGTTVTVVVDKDESCDDHYVAFSTSASPSAFSWSSASDRVLFAFNCDTKTIYSSYTEVESYCSTYGTNTWSLTLSATTATWTDTNCGTLTAGTYPMRSQSVQRDLFDCWRGAHVCGRAVGPTHAGSTSCVLMGCRGAVPNRSLAGRWSILYVPGRRQ